ncbi:NAD-binding protein [Pholiota conissans]|uniref:NAD-binding protein n=1 Tax=Pholiota conissans TaxID=109636 RepID=A0A9P6D335_9AGAR|nr:NAD-binding protein [Pholiota conissans]
MTTQRLPVVFITGCSDGGIGSGLVKEFLSREHLVYASTRSLASMSTLAHENLRKLAVDVTDTASVDAAVRKIYEEDGEEIDIVVANAGITCIDPLLDVTLERSQLVMDTNLFGAVRVVNAVAPRMAKRGRGLIVTIGSIVGELGTPFSGLYNTSKAALHAYTETLSVELRPLGVNVMLVSPGSVRSNIINNQKKTFALNPSSIYKDFAPQIERRLNSSQGPDSMPTADFCRAVVDAALAPAPPPYISLGGTVRLFNFLKWLNRQRALGMIYNSMMKVPA